jgi:hypothetical protein
MNETETIVTPTTSYEAWTDGWAVGFKVTRLEDGRVGYIYLNPSVDEEPAPASTPDVFLYTGPAGDPAEDPAWHHYEMDAAVFGVGSQIKPV